MDDGTLRASQIPRETLSSVPQVPNITVSLNGILKLLKDPNPNRAAGPDMAAETYWSSKARRRNCSSFTRHIPDVPGCLKTGALHTSVYCSWKEIRSILASSYKPISLTSTLCKVLEHIVTTDVVSHAYRYKLLYDLQHVPGGPVVTTGIPQV